jgi:hypothetical protein
MTTDETDAAHVRAQVFHEPPLHRYWMGGRFMLSSMTFGRPMHVPDNTSSSQTCGGDPRAIACSLWRVPPS